MSFVQLLPSVIMENDEETLRSLVTAGIDINLPIKTKEGAAEVTPLCLASERGYMDLAKILITNGASLTQCTKACVASHEVRAGAVIYSYLKQRRGALHLDTPTLMPSKTESLVTALNKNDPCDMIQPCKRLKKTDEGLTPLMAACKNGHISIVKYLCDILIERDLLHSQLAHKDLDGMDVFAAACVGGHLPVVKLLLQLYSDYTDSTCEHENKMKQNSLIFAAISGNAETVKFLIDSGVYCLSMDENKFDVLLYATYFGQLSVLQILRQHCPPILFHSNSGHCLELALSNFDIFKFLVEECDISPLDYTDAHSNSILHRAVNYPQMTPEFLSYITQYVNVNKTDYQGETALGILLQNPRKTLSTSTVLRLAEVLLRSGCNPNIPAPPRVPPLFMAVNMQSPPLVNLLIQSGANVSVKDLCEGTPLCALVTNISRTNMHHVPPSVKAIMVSLLDADTSVDQDDPDHVAFYGLRLSGELVEFLMQQLQVKGCKLMRLTSKQGLSLLQTAILRYNFHAIRYFLQRGFPVDTWVTVPLHRQSVFILNCYLGWNDCLIKCTPEVDEFNMVNRRDPSKSSTSRCRRYSMARLLTITGVPWSTLSTIVTPSLRSSCLQMFPISLQYMCRNSLRAHYGNAYFEAVGNRDWIIPELVRKYLLFSDFA